MNRIKNRFENLKKIDKNLIFNDLSGTKDKKLKNQNKTRENSAMAKSLINEDLNVRPTF